MTGAGDMRPRLFVSPTGTDSDFVVKLIDVFPDDYAYPPGAQPPAVSPARVFDPSGYQMLPRGEPFPARFREGFEPPKPPRPGVPVKISYVMPGVVHTFGKGHRIMLRIQSTWFPLVERGPQKFMPNHYLATGADFRKATERVYRDGARPSSIVLPLVRE